jgi:His-Xaa-Ser system protein HxsD
MPDTHDGATTGVTTSFDVATFGIDTVKRAAYRLSDLASFDISQEGNRINCRLDFLTPLSQEESKHLLARFRNEVLDQDLRRSIAEETAPVRNAILAYAFSRTGLQNG